MRLAYSFVEIIDILIIKMRNDSIQVKKLIKTGYVIIHRLVKIFNTSSYFLPNLEVIEVG